MMRRVTISALLALTAVQSYATEDSAEAVINDYLFHRAFRVSPRNDVDLESSTLAKPARAVPSLRANVLRPPSVSMSSAFRQHSHLWSATHSPRLQGTIVRSEAGKEEAKEIAAEAQKMQQNSDMMAKMKELQNDPEFKEIFDEMKKGGPAAVMKYYNDPDFLAKIGKRMGDVPAPDSRMAQAMNNPGVRAAMDMQQKMMQNPEMQKKVAELKQDPELKPFFEQVAKDMKERGPVALQEMYKNPEFMKKLEEKMGETTGKVVADIQKEETLFDAAKSGNLLAIERCLTKGMDPNEADAEGKTPLHLAVGTGFGEVVQALLKAKANINAQDKGGLTPLHYAAGYGRADLAKALLDGGADPKIKESNDRTPLDIAKYNPKNPINEDEALLGRLA